MNQAIIVAILQMLLGFLQAAAYALLTFWAFRVFGEFPWEKYFKNVRFYYRLIPALALASLAFTPVKYLLELLFSFPLDFTKVWVPPLLKFVEGLGFLGLLVYLCFSSPKVENVETRFDSVGLASRRSGRSEARRGGGKKIWIWAVALAVILAALGGAYYYLSSQGYVAKFSLSRPEYLDYQNQSPQFSFSYPSKFTLDKDEENRFGDTYLIGLKLPSDNRVGCDVRAVKGALNLEGDLEEITAKLAGEISQGAEEFKVLNNSLMEIGEEEIGEEKAIKLEITFKGPLGETMRTDQVFTSHRDMVYTLICGTTKDTYEFFAEDFSYFLDHFSWK